METATLDRRARHKLATYRAIAGAARELTLARGLEHVTVDEIAEAADVSPRTFFNYFSCKEEAVIGVEPAFLDAIAEEVIDRPDGESPVQALLAVLLPGDDSELATRWVLRTELMRRYPQLLPRHMSGLVEMEQTLTRAVACRMGLDPASDPTPRLIVATAIAAFRSVMEWWHDGGQQAPLGDALRAAFDRLERGLGGELV
jgi:AcrR family transcriptional regulator